MLDCYRGIVTAKAKLTMHRRPDNDPPSCTDLVPLVATAQQGACATVHWRPGWLHGGTHVAHRHGMNLDLGELFTSGSAHLCTVGHEVCLVLLEFGILNETLVLANTTLLEATETEDGDTNSSDTANRGDDGNLGSRRHAVPALRD